MTIDGIWNEMQDIFSRHRQVLLAVVGLFTFLPFLAILLFVPITISGNTPEALMISMNKWVAEHWLILLLQMTISTFGAAVAYRVILAPQEETLQQALIKALPVLPILIATNLAANMLTALGLRLLILPGLYIAGRLIFVPPALIAREGKQPIQAIADALKASGGAVFKILVIAIGLFIASFVVSVLLTLLLGTVFTLMAPEAGRMIATLVQCAWISAISLIGVLLASAGWRLKDAQPLAK